MRLHCRHLDSQDLFRLGRHFLDDILLQSPQHERCQLLVQVFDLGFLVDISEIEVVGQLDYTSESIKESGRVAHISPASRSA
jgi:hypothetical protein